VSIIKHNNNNSHRNNNNLVVEIIALIIYGCNLRCSLRSYCHRS